MLEYVKGSIDEFRNHVEIPKWPELYQAVMVVTVSTILLSIFLFGVDRSFSVLVEKVFEVLTNIFN